MKLSRRHLMGASVALAGFTKVTGSIALDTVIHTSATGLREGMVSVQTADIAIPAYRAAPQGKGPHPVVLVVQEVFGVHEWIKDICRRLAKLGYLAIAPELYVRQGDVSKITNFQELMPIVMSVPDAQVMSDLDATAKWAAGHGGDAQRLAISGFCWGGRIVWLYASHSPNLKAGVAWYGRLKSDTNPKQPRQPIDVVAELKAPVLGLYGAADTGIPNADVEAMRDKLKSAGKPCEIVSYPDTPHGFLADYRESYREKSARDGWQRLQDWFKAARVAP